MFVLRTNDRTAGTFASRRRAATAITSKLTNP